VINTSVTASAPAAPMEELRPVASTERVELLDVLRGVALYGVLLANTVAWYSGRAFLPRPEILAQSDSIDWVALFVIHLLVDSKSMTLLAFLFGLGFAVQLARAEEQGRAVLPVYLRRLGILIAIGLCHVAFLWWGDILTSYALTGFALLLFRRRTDRALIVWALALSFVPHLVASVPPVAALLERVLPGPADRTAWRAQVLAAISGDDHVQLMRIQFRQALYHGGGGALSYLPWTLGRFLLGYLAGRSRWLHNPADHLPKFRKLLGWGIGIGLVGAAVMGFRRATMPPGSPLVPSIRLAFIVSEEIGVLATAAAYVAAVALLMQRPAWRRRLTILAPVGQMALTSYISQSLLCTFVFYGWGLGLVGRVGPALCIPLTLAIFTVQIFASRFWLRRFRFGPVEWVLRSLTYGRRQPMRRKEMLG
jgi:uncharacterized protein